MDDPSGLEMLCRKTTAYEEQRIWEGKKTLFVFETYDLMERNEKVNTLIESMDGVLVFVDYTNACKLNFKLTERIQHIKCRPLLVVVNHCKTDKQLVSSTNTNSFRVNHIKLGYNRETDIHSWFANKLGTYKNKAKKDILTSKNIEDQEMMTQFQDQTLPLTIWDHYGRLRIVYLSIIHHGIDNTLSTNGWLCSNWKKYKDSIGHGHLWNYTLTIFWVKYIHNLIIKDKPNDFKHLYKNNSDLHNGGLHQKYYTNKTIFSDKARNSFIAPDIESGCVIS